MDKYKYKNKYKQKINFWWGQDGLLTEIEAHEEVSHGEVANQKPERWYGWQNHVDFDDGGGDDDFDNDVDDGGDYGGDDKDDDRPWDIDPVPAAREDEDHAAVAEQGEQEDDPDSTSESPPEDEYVGDDHDLVGDDHDHVDDNEEQAEEYNNEQDGTIAKDPVHPEGPASYKRYNFISAAFFSSKTSSAL